jgi:hypothetical protein
MGFEVTDDCLKKINAVFELADARIIRLQE